MVKEKVKKFLRENEDKNNAVFEKRIVATDYYLYGIKTPLLDQFAKGLVKEGVEFADLPLDSYEEVAIAGFALAKMKISPCEKIKYFDRLIKYFDNWAHCDMIVSRLKGLESKKEYFVGLLSREGEFEKRVGIIYLMSFCLKTDLKRVIEKVLSVNDEAYYVKMAQAWTIANAGVIDFEYIYAILPTISDKFLRNKSISKMCDSFRITSEQKEKLRKLRLK